MSNRLKVIIALLAVPALVLGWWLGSPLLLDRSVDEAFPVSAPLAAEFPSTVPEEVEDEATPAADETMADDRGAASEPAESPGPVALAAGTFRGADDFHDGSGVATFYELENGSRALRFEDFEVTNGPDLRVLLVPHENPQSADDISGYLELEPLKGNVGNQNYEIPAGADLSHYGSIVIYCKPFHVLFAVVSLGR